MPRIETREHELRALFAVGSWARVPAALLAGQSWPRFDALLSIKCAQQITPLDLAHTLDVTPRASRRLLAGLMKDGLVSLVSGSSQDYALTQDGEGVLRTALERLRDWIQRAGADGLGDLRALAASEPRRTIARRREH